MADPASRVRENIQAVLDMQVRHDRQQSLANRIGDAIGTFAGTVTFVVAHLVWFAVWAAINLGWTGLKPFDPYPFQLLCMIVSMEGVLLSTFVLIKQNRMSRRSDRRDHLDLQVNLLTEVEVTKVIQMLERISAHLQVDQAREDPEVGELGRETAVQDLARELSRQLPDE